MTTATAAVSAPAERAEDLQDRTLLLVTLLLVGTGLTFVLSASQALAYVEHRWSLYYFARQLAGVAIGLVAMVVLMRIDYRRLRPLAQPAAIACGALMVLVLVPHLGVEANGARRWFSLGPLGTFQPSELAKLAFILFLGAWIEKRGDKIGDLYEGLLPFALMLAAVLAVLMLEKDLGTALVTAAIFTSVFFAGGGRKRHLAALLLVLGAGFLVLTLITPYRAARLAVFTDPFRDPLNTGFQSSQALIALGRGGLHGVGLGHSVQKFLWLPAAHTDFIFAIIGEETGLIGTTAVLAGYVVFAWRGYRAALRAPDRLGVMLAVGISTWIAVQALINMGTVTSTLPATGVPLPFISYGGTSVVILLAAVGVLLSVASQGRQGGLRAGRRRGDVPPGPIDSFRRIDADLDSGRRDWRASDAGSRRRSSLPR